MFNIARVSSALVLLLGLMAAVTGQVHAEILATVNGDSITSDMMVDALGRIHMMQMESVQRSDFSAARLLQKLINNRLIVQEARAIGLQDDSSVVEAVRQYRETLAYRALLKESMPDTFSVTDAEMQAVFEHDYQRLDLRYLCVLDSTQAIQFADSIRRGAAMDQIAREHSVDRYKTNGGLATGQVLKSLPESLQAAFAGGQLGDLVGPQNLWRVWASLRLEARHPADSALYDSVKAELRQSVLERKRSEYRRQFIDGLRSDITTQVDTAQVDSILVRMRLGQEETERPVATVAGDRVLTAKTLRGKYIHKIAGRNDRDPRMVLNEVLREQLDVMILKEVAKRREFVSRPEFDQPLQAYEDSVLIEFYLEDVVAPTVKVTDDDVAEYYTQNEPLMHGPASYKVATITRDTQEDAEADYQAISSGTDFAWLAGRHSTDDFKEKGGERDWLIATGFPAAIRAELDSLPIGGVLHPASLEEGFVIMKLIGRKAGERLSLPDVTKRIRSTLERQKQLEAIDAAIKALRDPAKIDINQDALDKLQIIGPVQTGDAGEAAR